MKREPIGPPPNRQTTRICLQLFEMLRVEALKLTPRERAEFRDVLRRAYPEIADPLCNFLRKDPS